MVKTPCKGSIRATRLPVGSLDPNFDGAFQQSGALM